MPSIATLATCMLLNVVALLLQVWNQRIGFSRTKQGYTVVGTVACVVEVIGTIFADILFVQASLNTDPESTVPGFWYVLLLLLGLQTMVALARAIATIPGLVRYEGLAKFAGRIMTTIQPMPGEWNLLWYGVLAAQVSPIVVPLALMMMGR